jgi:hypothetical protein
MSVVPFGPALGAAFEALPPRLREHFLQPPGTCRYRGVMRRVWRRGGWQGALLRPVLWLASFSDKLLAQTGENVPFEMEHTVTPLPDGRATMTFDRQFHFPGRTRRFSALWVLDPAAEKILDLLGKDRRLEVELDLEVEEGIVMVRSGRQWVRLGPLRLHRPVWLSGLAEVREWERADGDLEVCVTISNPLLGAFFGYEGSFARVEGNGERTA